MINCISGKKYFGLSTYANVWWTELQSQGLIRDEPDFKGQEDNYLITCENKNKMRKTSRCLIPY